MEATWRFFITFEGLDGCGKSTQMELLAEGLRERGFVVLLTREPGGTSLGEAIRDLLLDPRHHGMSARAEALLYAAARAHLVEHVIRGARGRPWTSCPERFPLRRVPLFPTSSVRLVKPSPSGSMPLTTISPAFGRLRSTPHARPFGSGRPPRQFSQSRSKLRAETLLRSTARSTVKLTAPSICQCSGSRRTRTRLVTPR